MIKLIVFDLWDTLACKGTKIGNTAYLMKMTNTKIPREKFITIFEKAVQTKRWKSKYKAYKLFCKRLGFPATEENINSIIKARDYLESKVKLFKHTLPMLKKLRELEYKIGIISNTSIFAIYPLKKKTSLLRYIDFPLFSYDAGMIKPDPRIFRKMLKLAKVRSDKAIMIGDKLHIDVMGANKIGVRGIQFKTYPKLKADLKKLGIPI
jgi:putative hydrolase of the HAD superfamily